MAYSLQQKTDSQLGIFYAKIFYLEFSPTVMLVKNKAILKFYFIFDALISIGFYR